MNELVATTTVYDVIGLIGVGLIILLYALLQIKKLSADHLSYSIGNLVGAILILISLTKNFNLPSVVIELFWIAISLVGIVRILKQRLGSKSDSTSNEDI